MFLLVLFICGAFDLSRGQLWRDGVVHYAINSKHYDPHSQELITTALSEIEAEVCLKFFKTPFNYTVDKEHKILYITNADMLKECQHQSFNYSGGVVEMTIGYRCLNKQDIARVVMDMLRASIAGSGSSVKTFLRRRDDRSAPTLLSAAERNYVNTHYIGECAHISNKPHLKMMLRSHTAQKSDAHSGSFSSVNQQYYKEKRWPLGVIMYGIDEPLKLTESYSTLKRAMAVIELETCVTFQEQPADDLLAPQNFIWFGINGSDLPTRGFTSGKQELQMESLVSGTPGHTALPLLQLMTILGVPMMSNRPDRDNYVQINWKYVVKGKEHLLERADEASWVEDAPYDFASATHAPANYLCGDACATGARTVEPISDQGWQRTLTMGHTTSLSAGDKRLVSLIYADECVARYNMQSETKDITTQGNNA